jgi:hypothetical protein
MKKKYLLLFTLFLYSSFLFSQTKKKETTSAVETLQNTTPTSSSKSDVETPAVTSLKPTVFEKNPLPKNTKSYPEVVYLINDKPVDYRTYIHYIQKNKK